MNNQPKLEEEPDPILGDPFLWRRSFWVQVLGAIFLGLFIGILVFVFFNIFDTNTYFGSKVDAWYDGFPSNSFQEDVSGLGTGRVWWLAIIW